MHDWGSEWFEKYGEDLNDAVDFVAHYCMRWGRFGGDHKEKYGTLRFYAMFHHQLHDLFYPGHYYIRWGKPFVWIDHFYMRGPFGWFRALIQRWQTKIYRRAYRLALARWPHLRKEILCCADYSELLEGL